MTSNTLVSLQASINIIRRDLEDVLYADYILQSDDERGIAIDKVEMHADTITSVIGNLQHMILKLNHYRDLATLRIAVLKTRNKSAEAVNHLKGAKD